MNFTTLENDRHGKRLTRKMLTWKKVDRKMVAFFHTGKRLPFSTLENDRHGKRSARKRLIWKKLDWKKVEF